MSPRPANVRDHLFPICKITHLCVFYLLDKDITTSYNTKCVDNKTKTIAKFVKTKANIRNKNWVPKL